MIRKNYKYKFHAALSAGETIHGLDKGIFGLVAKNLRKQADIGPVLGDMLMKLNGIESEVVEHLNEFRDDLFITFDKCEVSNENTLIDSIATLHTLVTTLLERYGLAMAAIERLNNLGHDETIAELTSAVKKNEQWVKIIGKQSAPAKQPPGMRIGDRVAHFEKLTPINEEPNYGIVFTPVPKPPSPYSLLPVRVLSKAEMHGVSDVGSNRTASTGSAKGKELDARNTSRTRSRRRRSPVAAPVTPTRTDSRLQSLSASSTTTDALRGRARTPRNPYVSKRPIPRLPVTDIEWRASRAILDDVDWNILQRQLNRDDQLIIREIGEDGLKDIVTNTRSSSKEGLRQRLRTLLFKTSE